MEELHKLQTNYMITVANEQLWRLPFRLTITRAGCEYDGEISAFKAEGSAETGERLQRWYEATAVSEILHENDRVVGIQARSASGRPPLSSRRRSSF